MLQTRKAYFAVHNFSNVVKVNKKTSKKQHPYKVKNLNPFYYPFNKIVNHFECLNFTNFFIDFKPKTFEKEQAKMIFEEVGVLLERRDYNNAKKHCNEIILNVNFYFFILNSRI